MILILLSLGTTYYPSGDLNLPLPMMMSYEQGHHGQQRRITIGAPSGFGGTFWSGRISFHTLQRLLSIPT